MRRLLLSTLLVLIACRPAPELTATPTAAVPAGKSRLRVVADGPPPYVAEALLSVGTAELSVGPPDDADVLLLAESCRYAAEALTHPGRRLVLLPCPAVLAPLGLPEPTPLPAGATDAPDALPVLGAAWARDALPPSVTPALTAGDRVVAVRAGRLLITAFDLSALLRTVRQGSPDRADADTDGVHGAKPNDLAPYAWDEAQWRRAGADRWARWLLAELSPDWPTVPTLPEGAPTVLVLTFDQDFAEPQWIDPLLARIEQAGGTATVLRTDTTRQKRADAVDAVGPALPPRDLRRWRRAGHGIGLHPHVVGTERSEHPAVLRAQATRDDGTPRTVRHHFLRWWGWGEPLRLHAELGLWMDLTFVGIEPRFRGPGFGFGAALPARFQDETGALIPLLVQPTQLEDDVLIGEYGYSHGLDVAGAIATLPAVFDEAQAVGGPVVVNLHPTLEVQAGAKLLDALLAEAQRRGAPVWSAERWAAFTWARLAAQGAVAP